MDEQLLFAEARLGLDVESFLASQVGRYLIGRADAEAESALLDLADIDPEDAKAVRTAQNRHKLARSVRQWLEEAIEAGRLAEDALRESGR